MKTERQLKIIEQVEAAEIAINKYNYNLPAIITASKLSERSKKEFFGFRFLVNEFYSVGDTIKNDDGSISKIEAILLPKEI
jgi:hypothetical protein